MTISISITTSDDTSARLSLSDGTVQVLGANASYAVAVENGVAAFIEVYVDPRESMDGLDGAATS
ncbi:hypothetical protein [Novosphingobium sp. BL-52-GroH]|uniref:hypothetical protein n=1 Tax=Novosphingobium sp. BL-52-GroH TaxID=3349877 RepID=UPI00384E1B67